MKKNIFLAVMSCLMLTASAHADEGIRWRSYTYFLKVGGNPANYPADYIPADTLRLLIWSASAPPVVDYAQSSTGIGAGEYILWSSAVDPLRAGDTVTSGGVFNFSATPIVKTDAAVGGNNINAGYIYSRIFSSVNPVAGSYYYQSLANFGPAITEYNAVDLNTILAHNTTSVEEVLELLDTNNPTAQNGMYTVVPEPGSLLLAFPVLGVMAVRRMRRRD